jgi:tRNA threonylcarbamoyladenosine biosynthesis protein TsaE
VVNAGQVVLRERGVRLRELETIGRRLARCLRPGDVVFLYGPLGSGKTTFARAIATALEVKDPVRSPSFTIANIYEGALPVQHLDLYRLEEIGEEDALAIEEYVRSDAVTLVEWPQAGAGRLGRPVWIVRLDHVNLRERSVEIEGTASDATDRWEGSGHAQA